MNKNANKPRRQRTNTDVDVRELLEQNPEHIIQILKGLDDKRLNRAVNTAINGQRKEKEALLKGNERYKAAKTRQRDARNNLDANKKFLAKDAEGKTGIDRAIENHEAEIETLKRKRETLEADLNDGENGQPVGHFVQSVREADAEVIRLETEILGSAIEQPENAETEA